MHWLSSARSRRGSAETTTDSASESDVEARNPTLKMMIGLVQHPNTLRGHNNSGVAQTKKTVYLKDDVLSSSTNGYFLVKDETGETCCRIHGEAALAQNSGFDIPKVFYKNVKVFTDGWGRPLFTLKRKQMSIHQGSQVYDLTGKALLETRSKFSFTKNKMTASFVNLYDGQPVQVEVSGKYTTREATIKLSTGQLLGRIIRTGSDQYAVEIYPGVDVLLLVLLAVAFSEQGQDNNRSAWTT